MARGPQPRRSGRPGARRPKRRTRVPSVFQIEASECGAACLAMVLRHYGCQASMEQVRAACGVSRDGCSAADIVRGGAAFGLKGAGYRKPCDELHAFPTPCIVHWGSNHFVVLEGFVRGCAFINDPASGRRRVPDQEFARLYSGVALYFVPGEGFVRQRGASDLATLVARRLGSQGQTVAYLLAAGMVLVLPGALIPILSQVFIDNVLMRGHAQLAGVVVGALVCAYAFQMAFTYLRARVLGKLKLKLSMMSAAKVLHRFLRMPLTFFEQRYPGELSQRLESNAQVNNFLAGTFSQTVLDIFQACFFLALMLAYSPLLTAAGLAGVALNVALSLAVLTPLSNLAMKQRQDQGRMSGVLCAGMSVISTIKASGAENEYAADVIGHYADTTASEQRLGGTRQILGALPGAVSNLFNVLVLVLGGLLVIEGSCTAGTLVAFCMALASFTQPVNALIAISQKVQVMEADMARIQDILGCQVDPRFAEKPAAGEKPAPSPAAPAVSAAPAPNPAPSRAPLAGLLAFDQVTFSFSPGAEPVVRDFSLRATPGSQVALVGASGCGKSTVVKLALGLLEPCRGTVSYDGIPLGELAQSQLCCGVAAVNQNATLFSGSVRDNLTLWNADVPDDALWSALEEAAARSFVANLPGGLDFRLDECGRNLSGGQRQQLEIARALLKDPAVLVLDEATSSLDAQTERRVLAAIRRRGCTCLTVAHRLSTVKGCDLIMVMDRGRVAQCGTHEQLFAQDGPYRRLIQA